MESNIGMVDRYFRLASGLVLLGTAMTMRKRSVLAKGALLSLGAMKITEGATGWCPLIYLADTMSGNNNSSKGPSATSQSGDWSGQQSGQQWGQQQFRSGTNAQSGEQSSNGQQYTSDHMSHRTNRGDESFGETNERQATSERSRRTDSRNDGDDERTRTDHHQGHRETTAHRSDKSESRRERMDDSAPIQ